MICVLKDTGLLVSNTKVELDVRCYGGYFIDKYNARDLIQEDSIIDRVSKIVWRRFWRVLPGYIFLLVKKPAQTA